MMYQAYQAQTDLMWPLRAWARVAAPLFLDDSLPATSARPSSSLSGGSPTFGANTEMPASPFRSWNDG